MSFMHLAFSSDGERPLSSLSEGDRAVVVGVVADQTGRADRLLSLGVTPGVEHGVADVVIVSVKEMLT